MRSRSEGPSPTHSRERSVAELGACSPPRTTAGDPGPEKSLRHPTCFEIGVNSLFVKIFLLRRPYGLLRLRNVPVASTACHMPVHCMGVHWDQRFMDSMVNAILVDGLTARGAAAVI